MKSYLLLVLYALTFSSCVTSYYSGYYPELDIEGVERVAFDDLKLEPTHDLYDYRFNIIHQIGIEDNWRPIEAHHPLGMRLGNGLFFDLNRNLTLNLFSLLDLPSDRGVSLQVTESLVMPDVTTEHRISPYEYCYADESGPASEYCITYMRRTGGIEVQENNRHRYTIREESGGIELLLPNGFLTDRIAPMGDGMYTHRLKREIVDFVPIPNGVRAKDFYIVLTPDKKEIQIYRGKNKELLLRMLKTKDQLFIVAENGRGIRIQYSENQLSARGRNIDKVDIVWERDLFIN
ncbi:MAG: hypothetical protein AAGF87_10845 [Bacteroidota bacterium]